MKTLIFYLGAILSLIFSLIIGPITIGILTLLGKTEAKNKFIYNVSSMWARFVMKISFAKINITGLENVPKDETVLFVSNHQSYLDIPLLMGYIPKPKGFIAKKELESWPIVSYWMKKIRCIFMDRENVRKSAKSIVEGINILKSGYSMVIFPEGTRSKGIKRHEFNSGSFKLATKPKVPIVPVSIDGSYIVLSGKFHFVKKCEINLTIHPTIETNNLSKEDLKELPKKVEKIIFSKVK